MESSDQSQDFCPRCGYDHPNCKCWNEISNVPNPTKPGVVLMYAEGGSVPAASSVNEVLSSIPEKAGSLVDSAQATNSPINESMLGDPVLNGEHIVAHTGIQDFLSGKLNNDVLKASSKMELAGLGHVEKIINKHIDNVETHRDGVFGEKTSAPEWNELGQEEQKNLIENINTLAANPQALIDRIQNSTSGIHAVAPQTAESAQQTAARAISFLSTKSSQPDSGSLNKPYEPSQTEISKFNRYLQIVENPATALHQVKEGTLIPETLETLKAVYPSLYGHMKQGIIENLGKDIPFSRQMSMGQFLEEPLDSSLTFPRTVQLQGSYAQAQSAQNSPAPKSSKPSSALSKLDIADRTSLHPSDNMD